MKMNKKPVIGLLVSGVLDEFTRNICRGVFQISEVLDVNVIIFPGKFLDRDLSGNDDIKYEYQYNMAFSCANNPEIDALIVAVGTIGCFTTEERVKEMLKQYKDIPCILLNSHIEGYPCVVFDNYNGIKDAMEYLINKVGCKKFGMIGGSDENIDGYERKQAFISVLKDNGIAYNEKMFVEGDFSSRSQKVAAELLNNNPDIEAVFCVNDDTAMGLYEELKRRNLRAGRDLSVFGYDDTTMAAISSPSLSTIRADSAKMGYEAIKIAFQLMNGEDIKDVVVSTEFILRDSICKIEENVRRKQGFNDIFYGNFFNIDRERVDELSIAYRQFTSSIAGISPGEFTAYSDEYNNIIHLLEHFCEKGALHYADMNKFMLAISDMEKGVLRFCDDKERDTVRQLFSDINRKIVLYMNEHFGDLRKENENVSFEIKVFAHNMLQFDKGWEQSYGILLQNLEWLDIKVANIYIYEEPIMHLYGDKLELPDKVFLKATLNNGEVTTVLGRAQQYNTDVLLKDTLFSNPAFLHSDIKQMVLFPLFFRELIYGFIICNLTDNVFKYGELLTNQMSAAVKMIKLLQINEDIQQKLDENLIVLKENNVKLDTISKSDVLTGILNRRGFLTEAEKFFKKENAAGKNVAVLYVDMNNLKIINDKFGHDEGDFSLKLIGTILSDKMKECGIAGRIGGDEYACVFSAVDTENCESVINEIYAAFTEFNKNSDKVYNITVSIGAYLVHPESDISLEDALIQADESLYQVKQHRTKEVLKEKMN